MSRLDFAPGTDAMEVTDIESGHFVFAPRADRPVRLDELDRALADAGYEMERAWIEVEGDLETDSLLRVPETGQVFRPSWGADLHAPEDLPARTTVFGEWRTTDAGDHILVERVERHGTGPP